MDLTNTDIKIDDGILQNIDKKKKRIDTLRPISKEIEKKLLQDLKLKHTYHSIAIGGNKLTQNEVKRVIEDGIAIGGKSLKDHLEAKNDYDAFNMITENKRMKITGETIKRIHELVTRGIMKDGGKYRTINMKITGGQTSTPDYNNLTQIMSEYIKNIRNVKLDPIKKAAYIQHGLLRIHPFVDGNGRVARLLTNLYLIKQGYPPIIIKKEDTHKYYRVLQEADNGDLSSFATFIAIAANESLMFYLSNLIEDEKLIPLNELSKDGPYTQEYLSLRARQGQIDAIKIENIWYSTKQALEDYILKMGK